MLSKTIAALAFPVQSLRAFTPFAKVSDSFPVKDHETDWNIPTLGLWTSYKNLEWPSSVWLTTSKRMQPMTFLLVFWLAPLFRTPLLLVIYHLHHFSIFTIFKNVLRNHIPIHKTLVSRYLTPFHNKLQQKNRTIYSMVERTPI